MEKKELIDDSKVLAAQVVLKDRLARFGLNIHERNVVTKNMAAHEAHVLEQQNLTAAMFSALNPARGR